MNGPGPGPDDPGPDSSQPDAPEEEHPGPVTVCAELAPVPGGTCTVSGTGGALHIRGTVLAPEGVLVGGQVVVDAAGEIQCVGCDCQAEATAAGARQVDCGKNVVSPGLVNPHDHLTFTEGHPIAHGSTRYEHRHGWRGTLKAPSNPHGTGATGAGNRWGELRHLMGGTTSLAGSGHADGLIRNLDRAGAPQGLGLDAAELETFPLGDSAEQFRASCGWSYKLDASEVAEFDAYVPHVAEGIDAYAADEVKCQLSSSGGGRNYAESNVAMVHAMGLRARDAFTLAHQGTKIIWSPRSNIDLYGMTAPVTLFHRLGGVIALGTDWTYSGSIHMGRELACADSYNREYLDGYFDDRDLWHMATLNGAVALGAGHRVGSLGKGMVADISVFAPVAGSAYRAVVGGGDVLLVLRGGVALYGEADLVAALRDGCDALDVCGARRRVCLTPEIGQSYEALAAAVSGAYPAFFCGGPTHEPTCTPSRAGVSGVRSDADLDGDGRANADDLCPRVYDPLRPLDGGSQPDADDDGIGDACDDTPFAFDLDGDGVDNEADLCPLVADDQLDADTDSRGDACDDCPAVANAERGCPLAPPDIVAISAIQNGMVAVNARVSVEGVVTAVSKDSIVIQEQAGGAWSGIYVFTASMPAVTRDQRVRVVGVYNERFGNSQLVADSVEALGSSTPVAPEAVTLAQATSEAYEGVLVTVTDGAVTNAAYTCAVDPPAGACNDMALWEVGGATGVLFYNKFYEPTDWAAQAGKLPATGVVMFRFERVRIMPRVAADFPQ